MLQSIECFGKYTNGRHGHKSCQQTAETYETSVPQLEYPLSSVSLFVQKIKF